MTVIIHHLLRNVLHRSDVVSCAPPAPGNW